MDQNSTPIDPQQQAAANAAASAAGATAAAHASTPGSASAGHHTHGTAEPGALPTVESLQAALSELQARHTEVSDAYLRAKAETENIRRRTEDDLSKTRKFAVESFAESMLPVRDSLEAAIATSVQADAKPEQIIEGIHATLRQLTQALERSKVQEIAPAAGEKFDPHRHQAISMVPGTGQEPGSVVQVLQKGYLIADRVLRPALVMVAQAA